MISNEPLPITFTFRYEIKWSKDDVKNWLGSQGVSSNAIGRIDEMDINGQIINYIAPNNISSLQLPPTESEAVASAFADLRKNPSKTYQRAEQHRLSVMLSHKYREIRIIGFPDEETINKVIDKKMLD